MLHRCAWERRRPPSWLPVCEPKRLCNARAGSPSPPMATSARARTNGLREQAHLEQVLRLILAHVRQVATTAETSATVRTDGTEEVFRLSMDSVDYALARSVLQSHQQSVGLSPREQAI